MAAYLGYMALIVIQMPLFYRKDRLKRQFLDTKGYLFLCFLELMLLTGLRGYTVGADTRYYLNALEHYGSMPFSKLIKAELIWPYDYEIGYFYLVKLCAALKMENTEFLFLVAALIYIPLFIVIKKYSPMPHISILCYFAFGFFSHSIGIFRQMIATSILFCGWQYIERRKFGKYFLLTMFAMTFHTTAIAGLLLYFLYGVNWKRVLGWLVPVQVALLLGGRVFVMMLLRVLPKYARYLGSKHDVQGGTYLMLVVLDGVLLASVLFRSEQRKKVEDMSICALILATCVNCIGYSMGVIARATAHLSVYLIFAIPGVLRNLKQKIGYRWTFVLSLIVMAVLFVFAYREFDGNKYVMPYYTFWN